MVSEDGTLRVRNVDAGGEVLFREGVAERATSLAFKSDGLRLAWADEDRTVWVLNTFTSNQKMLSFKGHADRIVSLAFGPVAGRLAVGGEGTDSGKPGEVKVWELTDVRESGALGK